MKQQTIRGASVPQLGQGTWQIGDTPGYRVEEIAALRRGLDLGMTLIDTAEMYGSGRSESLVGEAIHGRRAQVYLVSKVLPSNASAAGVVQACENSLRRLGTDTLDLYLLHWRGSHPLSETLAGFQQLQKSGKIRAWGVSNFDVSDMEEMLRLPGGDGCAANQVLYNPEYRGIEYDLIPWCEQHGVCIMAYSPVGQGGDLLRSSALTEIGKRLGATPAQVALSWCMRQPVLAIPKAGSTHHVEENRAAADLELTPDDLDAVDEAYPPPRRKQRLGVL